ncbi:MAG TPA: hypothetical protein PL131_12945 [Methylotenera sp.]|nr:hypothetical protein [Methylotenera sp.]HPH06771.1 hypothetical protein [Methylotenera sp.]HPM49866.1 hypothetical protein [Methylotenera sp.]
MTSPNPKLWPSKSRLAFYNGWGRCLIESKYRRLDLSDTIMLNCKKASRTIYMGIFIESPKWQTWSEDEVIAIENLVRYDLGFDAYSVSIKRMAEIDIPCSNEFRWKLLIRAKF